MNIKTARQIPTLLTILFIAGITMSVIQSAQAQTQGTGLPLPRYVSLRAAEVNLRTGPGVQYPVEWIFQRESLPVEIIKEYRTWRLVRDWEGTQGWMHQSMLSGKRTFLVTGKERTIRSEPDAKSRAVAIVESSTIGEITSCPSGIGWCKVRIKGIEGWLRRVDFWGVYRNEVFE
ncbi:SH3 domain-containing protein [Thalassospiraceae bacterium LMO-JJ14]|nr:SH3 domain-containing protein [Thalassospiraceae bacterium LMO-JJ14]